MTTGNSSKFLDTDGTVAWLFQCPRFFSLISVLEKWYDRIPFLFERTTKFIDPITCKTYEFASQIPCFCDYTNVFQLDLENENSWCQPSPDTMLFNKPLLLRPTELDILLSFLLSTIGVLEYTHPRKRKNSGKISSMPQLKTLT